MVSTRRSARPHVVGIQRIRHCRRKLWMILGLVLTISLNFLLLIRLPFVPPKNAMSHSNTSPTARLWMHDDDENPCNDFGCPIYPAELTSYLQQLLQEASQSGNHTIIENFNFGSEHYALLTQKGGSHSVNQDRAVLVAPFRPSGSSSNYEFSFFSGIFDGHGREGHIVANYIVQKFPELLAEALQALDRWDDDSIMAALNKTFVEVDIYGPPNMLRGGSTGSVVLRRGSKLFVANTGDSKTFVASMPNARLDGKDFTFEDAQVVFNTVSHKAILPEEYARIKALNGTININSKNNVSHVVVYSVTARESIALAMSRSIGDWEWKPIGVTAEPTINVIDLNLYSNPFLVTASDGFFDPRRDVFYAKQFSKCFFFGEKPPLLQSWDVFQQIAPHGNLGYRDDMTAIVVKL